MAVACVRDAWVKKNMNMIFFQAEDGIRDIGVTGVQTCALPISLKDLGDKVDAEDKKNVEEKLEALKKVKDGEDLEAIKKATTELTEEFYKVSSKLYQQSAAEAQAQQGAQGADMGGNAQGAQKENDDNVVDADFKVEDDK